MSNMMHQRIPLATGWTFKRTPDPDSSFLPCAQFPTCIHLDLLHHKLIPDPLLDDNETEVQWVGEEEWTYRTTFTVPNIPPLIDKASRHAVTSTGKTELVFDGLDTFCTVLLNGKTILTTENMYVAHRVDVTTALQLGENVLELRFGAAFLIGRKLEKEAGGPPLFCHNGDSSRLQVRKAPYSYGWDWGPVMLTCGPWRPVWLETFETRISDLSCKVDVESNLSLATVTATVECDGVTPDEIELQLVGSDGSLIEEQIVTSSSATFVVRKPELWYPVGNGGQPLYTLTATALTQDQTILCASTKRFGIRLVELIQRPLKHAPGTTFFFRINNIPIFCRGADWVPSAMFLPQTTPSTYRRWIQLMVNGNQNMARVWGGGIYEDDVFYDYCDELGIMVWQDFMLGCGSYPATPKFLKQIEEEAVDNLKRMRAHPSIVLWCGNNEDHMFADKYTDQYDPDDHDPAHWLKTNWPARIIYDKILPSLCNQYVPNTPYHPGSPFGGRPSNSTEAGDVHAWDVWMKASAQYPYQWYPQLSGRFVSEFGLKSYPTLRTINEFITDPKERFPQSRSMEAHMKASSKSPWARDYRTIALYLTENVKHGSTLEQYTYASQLIQAEAMMYAFVGFRRLWKGVGREECAGVLVWQLNDAWPSVSWSLVDSKLRKKSAYYSVKRAIARIIVGVARVERETGRDSEFTEVHVHREKRLQVWASNFGEGEEEVTLEVRGVEVTSGRETWVYRQVVRVPKNQSTELLDVLLPEPADTFIFVARLSKQDYVVARYFDWPQPLKYLDLPKPDVEMRIEGEMIHLSAALPVKGLVMDADDDDVDFEDNCLDLVPGDPQVVRARGLKGQKVTFMHLAIAV